MPDRADSLDDKPSWWIRNERLKERMGLPPYEPSRFLDDAYVFRTLEELTGEYHCNIRFVGASTDYLDDWEVRIDGETAFEIGRHRDPNGNTVYELTSSKFRDKVREWIGDG